METGQVELAKLSKQKLIEMIREQEEKLSISEECKEVIRLDLEKNNIF
jgi:hypothetical protein